MGLANASGLFDRIECLSLMAEISSHNTGKIGFSATDSKAISALNFPEFDIAIDFRDADETRFLLTKVKARFKAGFYSARSQQYMDLAFPNASLQMIGTKETHHQTLKSLLAAAVIFVHTGQDVAGTITNKIAQQATPLALKGNGKGPMIGLNVGSGNTEKNWPLDRFIALGQRLVQERGATLVLVGSKAQEEESALLAATVPRASVINVVGNLSLVQCAATIKTLDAYIGNDTGTTHLAAALGTPTVCLFPSFVSFDQLEARGESCISLVAAPRKDMYSIDVSDVLRALSLVDKRVDAPRMKVFS